MFYEGNYYDWSFVYMVSGLCKEDFTYDWSGSVRHFGECLDTRIAAAIKLGVK